MPSTFEALMDHDWSREMDAFIKTNIRKIERAKDPVVTTFEITDDEMVIYSFEGLRREYFLPALQALATEFNQWKSAVCSEPNVPYEVGMRRGIYIDALSRGGTIPVLVSSTHKQQPMHKDAGTFPRYQGPLGTTIFTLHVRVTQEK